MLYFNSTVASALRGEAVGIAILGRFDFADGTTRLWLGDGPLQAGGETWSGIGQWGGLSSIIAGAGDAAVPVTFTLSGVDTEIALKVRDVADVRGRQVSVLLQFFAAGTGQPLDAPANFWTGEMDLVTTSFSPQSATITVTAENAFTSRSKFPAGLLSDRDQKTRFPGDRGLEFVSTVVNKAVKWPNF